MAPGLQSTDKSVILAAYAGQHALTMEKLFPDAFAKAFPGHGGQSGQAVAKELFAGDAEKHTKARAQHAYFEARRVVDNYAAKKAVVDQQMTSCFLSQTVKKGDLQKANDAAYQLEVSHKANLDDAIHLEKLYPDDLKRTVVQPEPMEVVEDPESGDGTAGGAKRRRIRWRCRSASKGGKVSKVRSPARSPSPHPTSQGMGAHTTAWTSTSTRSVGSSTERPRKRPTPSWEKC